MIYKTRSESIELKKMRILNLRMELSERDKRYYYNLRMGYEGEVLFVNPEFTLYQASPDVPFILPTQNKQYFKQLNSNTTKLTSKHKMLADQLINAHIVESPFSQIPSYEYEKIHKGIYCKDCHSFSLVIDKNFYKCISCNSQQPTT